MAIWSNEALSAAHVLRGHAADMYERIFIWPSAAGAIPHKRYRPASIQHSKPGKLFPFTPDRKAGSSNSGKPVRTLAEGKWRSQPFRPGPFGRMDLTKRPRIPTQFCISKRIITCETLPVGIRRKCQPSRQEWHDVSIGRNQNSAQVSRFIGSRIDGNAATSRDPCLRNDRMAMNHPHAV